MLRKAGTVTAGPQFGALMKQWRTQWTAEEEAAHTRAEALMAVFSCGKRCNVNQDRRYNETSEVPI